MALKRTAFSCDHCGEAVALHDKECAHCGKRFEAVLCPRCRHQGPPATFVDGCPQCGYLAAEPSDKPRKRTSASRGSAFVPVMAVVLILLLAGAAFAWFLRRG